MPFFQGEYDLLGKKWDGWTEEKTTVIPNYARICWNVVSAIVAHFLS